MNKKEFNQFREDFSRIKHDIHDPIQFGINDEGIFYKLECARDNIGRITFSNTLCKKQFPNHFFQINQEGFLNGREMRTFQSALQKKRLI